MSQRIPMYRPYFSAKEINILSLALEKEAATGLDSNVVELYKRIRMINFKVQNDMINPALIRKETVEESIGAIDSTVPSISEQKERIDTLASKHMKGETSEEEIEEGKRLELIVYGSSMGLFE